MRWRASSVPAVIGAGAAGLLGKGEGAGAAGLLGKGEGAGAGGGSTLLAAGAAAPELGAASPAWPTAVPQTLQVGFRAWISPHLGHLMLKGTIVILPWNEVCRAAAVG